MKHQIEILQGTWAGKSNVIFAGAAFVSGNDRLLVREIVTAEATQKEGKQVTVNISSIGWDMVAVMAIRAYQAIKTHSSVNYKVRTGQQLTSFSEVRAHDQQEKAAGCRTCGS